MDLPYPTKVERSPSPGGFDGGARHSSPPSGRRSRSRSPLNNSSSAPGGGGSGGGSVRSRIGSRRLFLSNIPYECDWRKMKDLVKDEVGEDCFVDIALDRRGKNLGFGLLEFRTLEAAEKCVDRLNQAEVNGRRMIVREMSRRDEERWAEVQREKSAGNGSTGGSMHSSSQISAGNQGPVDIPMPIMQIMRRNGIDPPLSKSLFVANVAFECDERRLREIFAYAGRVAAIDLKREPDGASRGFGLVEFETEFEALQAICMFNGAMLHDRPLKVRFDVKADGPSSKFPPGVKNLGAGFGPNGEPLTHIGLLQSLPELLQLVSPNVFAQILNQATNMSGGFGGGLNALGLGGASSIAALAAAIASHTNAVAPPPQMSPHHHSQSHHSSSSHHRAGSIDAGSMPLNAGGPPYGPPSGFGGTWSAVPPIPSQGPSSNPAALPGGSRNEPCSVIVSNLPLSATWRQLKDRFSDVGEVMIADIVNRSQTSVTGLVRFATPGDAKRAVRLLHEARFEGRQMDVRLDF